LLDGDATLPIREPGERESDEETGCQASGQKIPPPGCPTPALADKYLVSAVG
jgi:hypothetical protein